MSSCIWSPLLSYRESVISACIGLRGLLGVNQGECFGSFQTEKLPGSGFGMRLVWKVFRCLVMNLIARGLCMVTTNKDKVITIRHSVTNLWTQYQLINKGKFMNLRDTKKFLENSANIECQQNIA